MHARRATTTIMVLALACGRSDPEPTIVQGVSTVAAAKPAVDACGPARAQETAKLLRDGCVVAPVADVGALALARWSPSAREAPSLAVTIELTGSAAIVDGRVVEAGALPLALREALEIKQTQSDSVRVEFVLAIDGDARLDRVQPLLAGLVDAKVSHGVLLFGSATTPRTPLPAYPDVYARISEQLGSKPAPERSLAIARALEPLVSPCAAMHEVFGSVAALEPAARCTAIADGIATALVTCGCPAWEPELISYLQYTGGPADTPRVHMDAVELDPTRPITVAGDTKWSSFVAERREPLGKLWLELGP